MSQKNLTVLICVFFSTSTLLFAQKNEVSFSVGAVLTPDQRAKSTLGNIPCLVSIPNCAFDSLLQTDAGVALQGTYARQLTVFGPATLYAEVPVVGIPGRDVRTSFSIGGSVLTNTPVTSSSSIFFTPSAKLKVFESAPISPFVTVGGGLAHSELTFSSGVLGGISSSFSRGNNIGALQFGGGLDFKSLIPRLGFRAEARDFYCASGAQSSSSPLGSTVVSPVRLHNVFIGGGAFFRF